MIDATQPIIGGPFVGHDRFFAVLRRRPNIAASQRAIETQIASAYASLGQLSGISDALAFAQGWLETDGFKSARWVKSNNSAGLGSTNDGAWGIDCASPAAGIIRQFAHLVNYATRGAERTLEQAFLTPFDPRLATLISKQWIGIAPRWCDLDGKWADPGVGYGAKVIKRAYELGLI